MECTVCQHQNVDNARFCAKCGALLPVSQQVEHDPLIGQVIKNTFRVMRLLGEGGMGRVYEGEQQMGTTTRKVAIKTLHPHLSQDPQIVARFNRECGTVAELEHPNTIQFFDFGQTPDGTLFIAMEFLEGESVAAELEHQGPMTPPRVENILRQVCGSLAEAHKKGIIHRDLKPDNVVLTTRAGEKDFVKVLDFGIAARREGTDPKKEQKLTQQGTVLGTPPYMSPEQFTGKELDARSDIYSLGVMAYEMLTGKLPFEADTPWEWATKHLTERPYPFEVTSPGANLIPGPMKQAIMRALSKRREDRQATVGEFYEELSGRTSLTSNPNVQGTMAMEAPGAEFGAGGTQAAMPAFNPAAAPQGQAYGRPQTANEMVVPAGQNYGPPPQPMMQMNPPQGRPAGGSSKLPIIIIGAVVGLGALVGIVFGVRAMINKGSAEEPAVITLPEAGPTVAIDPERNPGTAGAGGDTPVNSPDAGAKPTPQPTPVKSTPPTPTPPPTPTAVTGEEACQKSAQSARNQQIEQAVALYHGCEKGGRSMGSAKAAINQNAGPAARSARFRGDCAGAKRIYNAASSIGAAGTAGQEVAACK